MKPGTEYELFVKDVYDCLHRAEGLTDVEIQHDVKLTGLSGIPRQVDVFWSFKRAGISYKVAIECKDYNKRVSIDRVSAFHDVLNDLQDVHGIIATKVGFQKGALKWAEKYGIQAMIIRHPIDEDWKGRIRDLHFQLSMSFVDNIRPQIAVDKEIIDGMDIPAGFEGLSDEIVISYEEMTSSNGDVTAAGQSTMQELINKLPRGNKASQDNRYSFKFVNGILDGKYPVVEIIFTYDVSISTEHTTIYGDDVIKAIVKNIVSGEEIIIDKFDRASRREAIR